MESWNENNHIPNRCCIAISLLPNPSPVREWVVSTRRPSDVKPPCSTWPLIQWVSGHSFRSFKQLGLTGDLRHRNPPRGHTLTNQALKAASSPSFAFTASELNDRVPRIATRKSGLSDTTEAVWKRRDLVIFRPLRWGPKMGRFIEGSDRRQKLLLPDCLDDYVSEDSPVRVVDVFVEELDLESLGFAGAATTGRPGYHPVTGQPSAQ